MAVIAKATQALDLIARAHGPVRLADVASALAIPRSSAHRLLADLVELDILRRDDNGHFLLGARLLTWGLAAELSYDIKGVAEPHMRRLRDETGKSVNLHVLQGDHRVCIAAHRGPTTLLPPIPVGQALPLGIGATGKVLLAFSPAPVRDQVLQRLAEDGRPVPTEEYLSRVRAEHWATSANEQEVGLAAGATIITGNGGRVVAALAIGAGVDQLPPEELESLRPRLLDAARAISEQTTGSTS
ncbi:IclR family transcriptional regulator [Nocardioides marmotae]|uniref:IclR family transcriptional regulator n=1 Tax=Nocardioides marmotae TaxID=2663857 RepID=UPI0012B539FB|nr:IclR family transcriptional regulator [Nocardioides marmotae]MBC9732873.1 IclR family transcriptional regulator [Nocardioides marmotae]QKD99917.1 IclR family transcriptional regulator [Nocardioides marmotae]